MKKIFEKLTKEDVKKFFEVQFVNSFKGLGKKAPYAQFGPVIIKYSESISGPWAEINWDVYLFDGSDMTITKNNPVGRLTPVFTEHFTHLPFPRDIWGKHGDEIFEEFKKFLELHS